MLAVFNRFNPAYEEAAQDLVATPWQEFSPCRAAAERTQPGRRGHVRLHAQLDEIARTSQAIGRRQYLAAGTARADQYRDHAGDLRVGTVTSVVSFAVMGCTAGPDEMAGAAQQAAWA